MTMRIILVLVSLVGCAQTEEELVCEGTLDVVVKELQAEGDILRDDLPVMGTASHSGGFAIRSITIGGVAADNTGFNFSTWEALVPIEALTALARTTPAKTDDTTGEPLTGIADLAVLAVDACGDSHVGSAVDPVEVDLTPEDVIEQGALTVTLTNDDGRDYVPANGSWLTTVTVTAPVDATGVEVTLQSGDGTFIGTLDGNVTTLTAAQDATQAVAWLDPSTSSAQAFVSAVAGGATAYGWIAVVGAPTLAPSSGNLSPGDSLTVAVRTDGDIDTCSVSGAGSDLLSAEHAGTPLSGEDTQVADQDGGGTEIVVAADPEAKSSATLSLTCCDVYDQCSEQGTYTLVPTE